MKLKGILIGVIAGAALVLLCLYLSGNIASQASGLSLPNYYKTSPPVFGTISGHVYVAGKGQPNLAVYAYSDTPFNAKNVLTKSDGSFKFTNLSVKAGGTTRFFVKVYYKQDLNGGIYDEQYVELSSPTYSGSNLKFEFK